MESLGPRREDVQRRLLEVNRGLKTNNLPDVTELDNMPRAFRSMESGLGCGDGLGPSGRARRHVEVHTEANRDGQCMWERLERNAPKHCVPRVTTGSRRENLADVSQRLFREDQDRKEAKRNQEWRERFVKYKRLCAQRTDNAVDANTQTYVTRSRLSTPRGSTPDSRETEDGEYDSVRSSSPTMDANTIEHKYQVIRMRGGADTEPPHSPSASDEDTNVQDNPGTSGNPLPPSLAVIREGTRRIRVYLMIVALSSGARDQ